MKRNCLLCDISEDIRTVAVEETITILYTYNINMSISISMISTCLPTYSVRKVTLYRSLRVAGASSLIMVWIGSWVV